MWLALSLSNSSKIVCLMEGMSLLFLHFKYLDVYTADFLYELFPLQYMHLLAINTTGSICMLNIKKLHSFSFDKLNCDWWFMNFWICSFWYLYRSDDQQIFCLLKVNILHGLHILFTYEIVYKKGYRRILFLRKLTSFRKMLHICSVCSPLPTSFGLAALIRMQEQKTY